MEVLARLENGKCVIFKRGGVCYVRVLKQSNGYIFKSLKTGNTLEAIAKGQKFCHELEFRAELGFPITDKRTSDVIDEYIAYRTKEHEHGRTKLGMLRQIKRCLKFWREYAGTKAINSIDNGVLRDYVAWRRDYYNRMDADAVPNNARPICTDKEVVYNIGIMKTVLRWAHDKGYRGTAQLPTYTFSAKNKRVRPAFELREYRMLWRGLIKWEKGCENPEFLHTRQLLRDYVLVLANSGMRVGEANNIKLRDLTKFQDDHGRTNYSIMVRGKTGPREVIPRVSAVKYIDRLIARKHDPKPNDYLFAMKEKSKIITLIDQFNKVLELAGIERNSAGQKYSLYSLRHTYAVMGLRNKIPIYDIAKNMGTSVHMIEQYYGRHATPRALATTLGGRPRVERHPLRANNDQEASAE
jgi:integrase